MSMKSILIGLAVVVGGVGAWKFFNPTPIVAEEAWELDLPADASVPQLASAELQALVDRLAGSDPMDAAVARNTIGAKYQSAGAFLADLGPALRDPRPVSFEMVRVKFSGGGNTFIYYDIKAGSTTGEPAFASSVGQSLCYFLWQYEDASNSGFKGNFKTWWAGYAPAKGLPGPK